MNRLQFWLLDSAWPEETTDWVFLGRAVQRVGRMMFQDDWRDDDPSRGMNPEEWRGYFTSAERRKLRSEDVEAATQKIALERVLRARASFARIAKECRDGELESGIRPVAGGDITPLSASTWATEYHRLEDRLVFCQMRIKKPFARDPGGIGSDNEIGMGYIFIGRPGIDHMTWPSSEAIEAAYPEGMPPWGEMDRDQTLSGPLDRLMAGVDRNSLIYLASPTSSKPAKSKRRVSDGALRKWYDDYRSKMNTIIPKERDDLAAAQSHFKEMIVTRVRVRAERNRYKKARPGRRGKK